MATDGRVATSPPTDGLGTLGLVLMQMTTHRRQTCDAFLNIKNVKVHNKKDNLKGIKLIKMLAKKISNNDLKQFDTANWLKFINEWRKKNNFTLLI